jgi:hypothetical protein
MSGINASSGAPFNAINNTIVIDEVIQPPADIDNATWGIKNYSGYGVVTGNSIQGGYIGYYSKAGTTEFANNEIKKAYIGFLSSGAETVHNNTVEECHGDGMILSGLRGPLHHNIIRNNSGPGICVTIPDIDLGGGKDSSPGLNVLQGNGNFDLYLENAVTLFPTVFARYNIWDHTNLDDIIQYDIRDASDSVGLPVVDFLPLGNLGIGDPGLNAGLRIYPNPVKGKNLNIQSENGLELVEVLNMTGLLLRTYGLRGEKH